MNVRRLAAAIVLATFVPGLGLAQETKIRVIDIERIAAESQEGKKLFDSLKAENDKIMGERAAKEQEIREMQAKLNSEILSQDAKLRLQRDIQRKQTEAQRWLEDVQAEFEVKRQEGEVAFQDKLAPIVEQVAQENGIGLIIRATPGLTFVLDDSLDISPLVVEKLDAAGAGASPGNGNGSQNQNENEDDGAAR